MKPGVKYAFGRLGIFLACAVPSFVFLPQDWNPFLKLMVALVASAALSWLLLRQWRDEVAAQLSESMTKRNEQKQRLRSALAGDDDPATRT